MKLENFIYTVLIFVLLVGSFFVGTIFSKNNKKQELETYILQSSLKAQKKLT